MKEHLFTLESPDGEHRLVLSQEPPRRRTVIGKYNKIMRIETPWIQYMRVYSPLWTTKPYLVLYGSDEPLRTPDDQLMYLSMPHTQGSFCMGDGSRYLGVMEIEEIFWNTAFVEGVLKPYPDIIPATLVMLNHPIVPHKMPAPPGSTRTYTVPATPRLWIDSMIDTALSLKIGAAYSKTDQYAGVMIRRKELIQARDAVHAVASHVIKLSKMVKLLKLKESALTGPIETLEKEIDERTRVREEMRRIVGELQADPFGRRSLSEIQVSARSEHRVGG